MSRASQPEQIHDLRPGAGADADAEPAPDLDAEHDPQASRRASLAGLRREAAVQRKAAGAARGDVHAAAARALATPTTALPHAGRIQASFGPGHDVSKIRAHVGVDAVRDAGATALASGDHVAFEREPDLHTAAHEAAHVVQQARGVSLYGGVGEAGDVHEQQADAVADRVVAGESAADLLGAPTAGAAPAGGDAVQRKAKLSDATAKQQADQHEAAERASFHAVKAAVMLGVARIDEHAAAIRTMIEAPLSDAGAEPQIQSMLELFGRVESELFRLSIEVSSQDRVEAKRLHPEVRRLAGAVERFVTLFKGRGMNYAARHGDTGRLKAKTPHHLQQHIHSMYDAIELPRETKHDSTWGGHKSSDLQDAVMKDSVAAALACVRSVRMSVTTGKAKIVEADFAKTLGHFREIDALLTQDSTGKLGRGFAAQLREATRDASALQGEIASHPKLAELARVTNFAFIIRQIRTRVRSR